MSLVKFDSGYGIYRYYFRNTIGGLSVQLDVIGFGYFVCLLREFNIHLPWWFLFSLRQHSMPYRMIPLFIWLLKIGFLDFIGTRWKTFLSQFMSQDVLVTRCTCNLFPFFLSFFLSLSEQIFSITWCDQLWFGPCPTFWSRVCCRCFSARLIHGRNRTPLNCILFLPLLPLPPPLLPPPPPLLPTTPFPLFPPPPPTLPWSYRTGDNFLP